MDPGDAVFSHVQLESGRGAVATGPNMSGKSTLMRALGAPLRPGGLWIQEHYTTIR